MRCQDKPAGLRNFPRRARGIDSAGDSIADAIDHSIGHTVQARPASAIAIIAGHHKPQMANVVRLVFAVSAICRIICGADAKTIESSHKPQQSNSLKHRKHG
jgi:hypothetical protein